MAAGVKAAGIIRVSRSFAQNSPETRAATWGRLKMCLGSVKVEYNALPEDVRSLANKNYELLKSNPRHPSLHFKKVGKVWSVRVGIHHRAIAIAIEVEGGFLWV